MPCDPISQKIKINKVKLRTPNNTEIKNTFLENYNYEFKVG